MSTLPKSLPDDTEEQAGAPPDAPGVDPNQCTTAPATRGTRAVHGRAKAILARSGLGNAPREDD